MITLLSYCELAAQEIHMLSKPHAQSPQGSPITAAGHQAQLAKGNKNRTFRINNEVESNPKEDQKTRQYFPFNNKIDLYI